jgi:hypothetical protein
VTPPFHDREDFSTRWSTKPFAIMGNPLRRPARAGGAAVGGAAGGSDAVTVPRQQVTP